MKEQQLSESTLLDYFDLFVARKSFVSNYNPLHDFPNFRPLVSLLSCNFLPRQLTNEFIVILDLFPGQLPLLKFIKN